MRTKRVGRFLRASASRPPAHEYRVASLSRLEQYADLAHCVRLPRQALPPSMSGPASVGNYALALSKAVGRHGRVLALEPNPAVFAELVNSPWGSRVSPLNLAASSASRWAEMLVPECDGEQQEPLATIEARRGQGWRRLPVRCVRLDDLADAARPVSLVKIDVEGHESDVLTGAKELIERHRPTFVVEIEQRHLMGKTVGDVVQLLLDRRYDCVGIRGRELIAWSAFDVDRYQTEWLTKDDDYRRSHSIEYVNNFLFRSRA